ncbi:unnamed protein product [Effrenium voratum]|uniref:Uncharacterized protein n=1 Tax=Effrenium voratum TaxID=2562239 RepID=A0AA36IUG7_9DINO|nr:unnamed protein product [Effrenium voratum]
MTPVLDAAELGRLVLFLLPRRTELLGLGLKRADRAHGWHGGLITKDQCCVLKVRIGAAYGSSLTWIACSGLLSELEVTREGKAGETADQALDRLIVEDLRVIIREKGNGPDLEIKDGKMMEDVVQKELLVLLEGGSGVGIIAEVQRRAIAAGMPVAEGQGGFVGSPQRPEPGSQGRSQQAVDVEGLRKKSYAASVSIKESRVTRQILETMLLRSSWPLDWNVEEYREALGERYWKCRRHYGEELKRISLHEEGGAAQAIVMDYLSKELSQAEEELEFLRDQEVEGINRLCSVQAAGPGEIEKVLQTYTEAGYGRGLSYERCVGGRGVDGALPFAHAMNRIELYADVSYAPGGGRSHQGVMACYGGSLVQWLSVRQAFTTLSTAEAELVGYLEAMTMGQSVAVVLGILENGAWDDLLVDVAQQQDLVYSDLVQHGERLYEGEVQDVDAPLEEEHEKKQLLAENHEGAGVHRGDDRKRAQAGQDSSMGGGGDFVVYGDNSSAITIIGSADDGPWRTRHLRLRAEVLREKVKGGRWAVRHLPGTRLVADHLTKAMTAKAQWPKFYELAGMVKVDVEKVEASSTEWRSIENVNKLKLAGLGLIMGKVASWSPENCQEKEAKTLCLAALGVGRFGPVYKRCELRKFVFCHLANNHCGYSTEEREDHWEVEFREDGLVVATRVHEVERIRSYQPERRDLPAGLFLEDFEDRNTKRTWRSSGVESGEIIGGFMKGAIVLMVFFGMINGAGAQGQDMLEEDSVLVWMMIATALLAIGFWELLRTIGAHGRLQDVLVPVGALEDPARRRYFKNMAEQSWRRHYFLEGDTILEISKHKGKTYFQIACEHPDFVRWAVKTARSQEVDSRLAHFVEWATGSR